MRSAVALVGAIFLGGCGGSNQKSGTFAIGAGETTFSSTGDTDPARYVEEPPVDGGPGPGDLRFKPSVCDGVDLTPANDYLGPDELQKFFESRGISSEPRRLRPDLVLLKVQAKNAQNLELRVATLDSPTAAAKELHDALLEHGPGSWGFHRGNLSVLGPIGSIDDVIDVAGSTGIACFGTVFVAGRDDVFAIGGGYIEF